MPQGLGQDPISEKPGSIVASVEKVGRGAMDKIANDDRVLLKILSTRQTRLPSWMFRRGPISVAILSHKAIVLVYKGRESIGRAGPWWRGQEGVVAYKFENLCIILLQQMRHELLETHDSCMDFRVRAKGSIQDC